VSASSVEDCPTVLVEVLTVWVAGHSLFSRRDLFKRMRGEKEKKDKEKKHLG